MKVKNNKFQKGDVVFYILPDNLQVPWQAQIPVKIKTAFPIGDAWRYLVKFLDKETAALAGGTLHYVDEVNLVAPDEVNGYV